MNKFMKLTLIPLLYVTSLHAATYKIDSFPQRAAVYDLLSNSLVGYTPALVNVTDEEQGHSYGLSLNGYEKIVVGIVKVKDPASSEGQASDAEVTTQSLPGKSPNKVTVDKNSNQVLIELRPIQSIKLAVPY